MTTSPAPPGELSGGPVAGLASACGRADLVLALRAGSAQVTLELARVAAEMAARRAWTVFGYENPHDFARELLDRSGRWLRDLGTLGEAVGRLPALEAHLLGCNGTPALGRVAALQVAQVATPESLPAWVALARQSSVRELARAVRAAQARNSSEPLGTVESTPPATAEATPSECDAASPQPQPPEVIELRAADVLKQAIEQKVAFVPGAPFYPSGGGHNTMRINFSHATPDKIREGIARLGRVLHDKIGQPLSM